MAADAEKPIPRATYRVQLRAEFGFDRTAEIADYMARLGVSHLYASPYMKARPGSTHGYDIVDHNALNPELGDPAAFQALVEALRRSGLGQVLDFVPNHMGVGGSDNAWWLDVLEWGPDSPFAGYFDIEWEPDRRYLQGKVLVPMLGDQYGAVLESGALELRFDAEAGGFAVWAYGTHKLPIRPADYGAILGTEHPELESIGDAFQHLDYVHPHQVRRSAALKAELAALVANQPDVAEAVQRRLKRFQGEPGEPESWSRLNDLIANQHWRAAYFKVAADDINYRRFFNINELAGLRMEEPELFDVAHRFVLSLVDNGTLDGIRIDHIDGLYDPKGYCERLTQAASRPFYLVVEKILARHERLREDWPIDGTTGYEFANLLGGLFVDPNTEEAFTRLYADFTGRGDNFEDVVRTSKIRIMESEMASELHVLSRQAARIARSNPRTADFTANILHQALKETIARFPVYRTYVDSRNCDGHLSDLDRRDIDWAIAQARRIEQGPDDSVYDFLQRLLTGDLVGEPHSGYSRQQVLRFAMRFQQYSGPVMAKGLEDTAFYRYNRLVALNEVGGHPDHFGVSVSAFHRANQDRATRWPHAMLGTTTHDTKRGEDTRARLYALSEMPDEWERQIQTWSRLLRARRGDVEGTAPPDRNDEYLFYQLLLGAWPAELTGVDPSSLDPHTMTEFAERIAGAMTKSMREAKVHTTWAAPNEAYESAMLSFVHDALDVTRSNAFFDAFLPFQAQLARIGMVNGLSQTLLKLTAPGVPDVYQGCELWNFSLVDPDNRRPVDYAARRALLDEVEGADIAGLFNRWQDGAVKLALTRRVLALRADKAALFRDGAYEALEAAGTRAEHVVAFARTLADDAVVVATPRLMGSLGERPDWGDTSVPLPRGQRWRNALTGATLEADGAVTAAALFQDFPVALLVREE
ncbi:malto-oligosyltrehalose synthase [Azospirillum sp. sgz302134]